MSHEQSETIQNQNGKWINVYGSKTPKAGQQLPGTREYNTVDEAVGVAKARSEGFSADPLAGAVALETDPLAGAELVSSSKPSGLGRFATTAGESWVRRSSGQGENILGVGRALNDVIMGKQERTPFPGSNPVEKVLNVLRLAPPWAAGEMLVHPVSALSTATSEAMGAPREQAEGYGDWAGALTAILGGFAPTGASKIAKAFQSIGIGQPGKAAQVQRLQEAMQAQFPTNKSFPDIPLSSGELFQSMIDNPNASDNLTGLFNAAVQGGKKVKPDKVFKKLSNRPPIEEQVQTFDDAAARAQVGGLSRAQSPDLIERLKQQGNLRGDTGDVSGPTEMRNPPSKAFPSSEDLATMREAGQARQISSQPPFSQNPSPSMRTSGLPPELLAVSKGEAPAFLVPPAAEGTVPTIGEQALAGQDIPALARRLKLSLFTGQDGSQVLYHAKAVPRATLKALDRKGRLADIVNGPGTSPKPEMPTTAVVVRDPATRKEIRTVLTDTPETTASAIEAQPTWATVEALPAGEAIPQVIQDRGDLLAGFKQAEPKPPKLPLGEEPTGTVELGMGLPVRQIGKAMKRLLAGFDDDTRPVGKFQSGRVQLNRAAPGQKLGDTLINAITEEREWKGSSNQIVQGAGMSRLTRPELINQLQVQEGRARPMNERVAKAVRVINAERERYSQGLQEVGAKVLITKPRVDKTTGATTRERFWKPYEPRQNYVPMIPDNAEMVKYSADDLAQQMMRFNRGLDAQDARQAAEVLLARAKGERIPGTVSERIIELVTTGNPHAPSLHARTGLILPDEVRLLPDKAWPVYFNSTSREIPLARHLGPGDAKIDALRRANSVRPDEGVAEALDTFDYWRGSKTRTPSERFWDKLIAFGRNATTMRFMGPTTAIKQASQGIQVGAELSTKNFVRGIKGAFSKANSDEAARAGAHLDDLMQELRDTALTLSEEIHASASKIDKAVIASERGASAVSRISQITRHDQFWRRAGYLGAKYDLQDAVVAAQKGRPKAIALLEEHGLTPAATPQQIQRAAAAFSAKVNLTSDPIALPAFIYKMPTARLVTHLNRFTIGQQQRMVRDFAVPLAKAITIGDKAAMRRHGLRTAKLFGYGVVGGEVLADTLRTIAGRPDDRPGGTLPEVLDDMAHWRVPPKVLAERIGDNLLWAALLGYAQLAKEALFDTSTGGTAARLTSLALGPVGSSVVEGATRVANLAKADTTKNPRTGKSEMDRAKSDAWRTGIGSLTGVGRTVTQWTFPHSESSDRRRALADIVRLRNRPHTPDNIKKEADTKRWFRQRQGENISPAALRKAMQQSSQ